MGGSGYRPRVTGSLRVGGALGECATVWGGQACVCLEGGPSRKAAPPLRWEYLASPSLVLWLPSCVISGKSFHLSASVSFGKKRDKDSTCVIGLLCGLQVRLWNVSGTG